uniref:Uncharacterized protein n=1 Tax=viral metagenome TaxID=1070528 RepID=A0A6C0K8D5_9ZZZZ
MSLKKKGILMRLLFLALIVPFFLKRKSSVDLADPQFNSTQYVAFTERRANSSKSLVQFVKQR